MHGLDARLLNHSSDLSRSSSSGSSMCLVVIGQVSVRSCSMLSSLALLDKEESATADKQEGSDHNADRNASLGTLMKH